MRAGRYRGSHDVGKTCLCVYEHRPPVMEFFEHHIWPSGMGGPNVASNRIWLCPTTHANVHEILRMLVARAGLLTYPQLLALSERPVAKYAYYLALEGYARWKEANA